MVNEKKLTLRIIFLLSSMLFISHTGKSQGILERVVKKVSNKVNEKVDKITDRILDGKTPNTNTTKENSNQTNSTEINKGRPKLSEIKDEDFVQTKSIPHKNPDDTRFRIAKNLAIDMKGKYPGSYAPKWRFISYPSNLSVDVENWYNPSSRLGHTNYPFAIGEYNNKAVLRLHPFVTCECFADIIIKDSFTVITNQPQTFQLTNFRKILNERSTGEPCRGAGGNPKVEGGFEGKLTLSANENGDITMDVMIENYSLEEKKRDTYNKTTKEYNYKIIPSQVSYRYIAKGITIENEMSTEKANEIIAKEQAAKQRQKDYIAKMTKQADSLQKIFIKKYTGQGCKDCFVRSSNSNLKVTPTKTAYTNGYGDVYVESGTDWDINTKVVIRNKCNYPLTFIGIQQSYDDEKGYYLKEVTKTMEAGYNYSSDQGIMSSIFTSLIGGGSEFNFAIQEKYNINNAYVGSIQWIKVVKGK